MRLAAFAISAFFAALVTDGARADMPHYDVKAHCKEVAEAGGTFDQTMQKFCFGEEQKSYDALKPHWDALPPEMKRHCDEIARAGGGGDYTMLLFCVREEMKSAKDNGEFEFKY